MRTSEPITRRGALGAARGRARAGAGAGAGPGDRPRHGAGRDAVGGPDADRQLGAQRAAALRRLRAAAGALCRHAGGVGERARAAVARRQPGPEAGVRRRLPELPVAQVRGAVRRVPQRPDRGDRRQGRRPGGGAGADPGGAPRAAGDRGRLADQRPQRPAARRQPGDRGGVDARDRAGRGRRRCSRPRAASIDGLVGQLRARA